jgi:Ca2+-binding RTX toxin-like protein
VITSDGIMGAGINVQYTNISKVEVDGLGGNDTFDVLSTAPGVLTVLEGGAGNNTFNVAGNVTTPVIALNANGTSGFINQDVTSTDPNYNGIFASGLPVSVAGQAAGQVYVSQTSLTVTQDGAAGSNEAQYEVALGVSPPTPSTIWYLTIVAAPDPYKDAEACQLPGGGSVCGTSVQLSTDGVSWSSSLVLTFDASAATGPDAWTRTETIYVRATSTSVVSGDQTLEIMTSVQSTTPLSTSGVGFDTIAVSNIDVHVIDGDLPGLIVNVPAEGLNVVAGSSTGDDHYTVQLTKAPAPGETVTVDLSADDPRIPTITPLLFTSANWDVAQTVTITAVDNGVPEGERLSTITASVTSSMATGGVYSNGVVDNPVVHVNVFSGDVGGLLVLQPTGSTVVGPTDPSSYVMQLTMAPAAPVTVTILDDGKTLVSSSDARFEPTGGVDGAPAVVFDSSNWNIPITITVSVNPNAPSAVGSQPVQTFPAQQQVLSGIYGPLVIEGNETTPRTLVEGIGLPSEVDVPLPAPPDQTDNSSTVNTLNVFTDGNAPGYVGELGAISSSEYASLQTLYAPALAAGLAQSQFGQIGGLGIGGQVTFKTTGLTFAGGITYHGIQVVDVLLGSGSTSVSSEGLFTVSATVPGSITVIQGGGGDKKLVATGGGGPNSPLILLGNTTQDGSFYNSTITDITGEGWVYSNPGQSFIDASADPNSVIIYGGVGNSRIFGGGGGDQIFGGSGSDTITAGSGNDIIHADDGLNLDLSAPLDEVVSDDLNALIVTHEPSASDSPTGDPLRPTNDVIYGGLGHDIILMGHGVVDQDDNPITGTAGVVDAYTTDPGSDGLSSVFGAQGASTIVLAGSGSQTIDLGDTSQPNVIVKTGYVYFSQPGGWIQQLSKVGSSDPGAGGTDTITTGGGDDVIVSGTGVDRITGGAGNKIVLSDDGEVIWAGGVLSEVVSQDPTVSQFSTFANVVTLGSGNDIVFGGSGANTITLGSGNDIVVGANGQLTFDLQGRPATLQAVYPTYGAANTISLGDGTGVVLGGPGSSSITAGSGYLSVPVADQAVYSPSTGTWALVVPNSGSGGSGSGGSGSGGSGSGGSGGSGSGSGGSGSGGSGSGGSSSSGGSGGSGSAGSGSSGGSGSPGGSGSSAGPSSSGSSGSGGSGPGGSGSPGGSAKPRTVLTSSVVTVTNASASVALACSGARCKGTITLSVVKTVLVRVGRKTTRKRVTVVYGTAFYVAAAGQTTIALVRLSTAAQNALAATKRHGLSVTATATVTGGTATTTTITLKLAQKKPVKKASGRH